MKRAALWVCLAMLTVLVALAVQMPASVAQRWLAAQVPQLQLREVSGTLWQGQSARAMWGGTPIGKVEWTLSAASLITLQPRLALRVDGGRISGQTEIVRNFNGALVAEPARLRLPASWLQQIINQPLLGLSGEVVMEIERARLDSQGWLTELVGSANWHDAAVGSGVAAQRTVLGDLRLDWQTTLDGKIQGSLNDSGGALALSGEVSIANRAYRVRAQLAARSGDPRLREALSYLGQPDSQGQVRLDIFGPLIAVSGS